MRARWLPGTAVFLGLLVAGCNAMVPLPQPEIVKAIPPERAMAALRNLLPRGVSGGLRLSSVQVDRRGFSFNAKRNAFADVSTFRYEYDELDPHALETVSVGFVVCFTGDSPFANNLLSDVIAFHKDREAAILVVEAILSLKGLPAGR